MRGIADAMSFWFWLLVFPKSARVKTLQRITIFEADNRENRDLLTIERLMMLLAETTAEESDPVL